MIKLSEIPEPIMARDIDEWARWAMKRIAALEAEVERLGEIEHRVKKLRRAIHDGRSSEAITRGAIWVIKALNKKHKE